MPVVTGPPQEVEVCARPPPATSTMIVAGFCGRPAGVSSATLNGVSLDGMPKITSISTNSEAFFGRDPSKKERDREKDLPCTPSGRRARTNFTWAQIQVLSEYFKKSNYVQRDDVALLMEKTGLLERNIRVWFQNRRNQYDRAYEGKLAQHRQ